MKTELKFDRKFLKGKLILRQFTEYLHFFKGLSLFQ